MEIKRLFDIPYQQLENYPQQISLSAKENGEWITYSTQEFVDNINKVSLALLAFGIKKDDKVAIISNNRPEWNFVDLGLLQIGAINVPLYPTISEDDYRYIFNDAEIKLAFVSDNALFKRVQNIRKDVPTLQEIYTFNEVAGAKNWNEFLNLGKDRKEEELESHKASIDPQDLATIIYTSGTTGVPKGVMLTHYNIVSNINACIPLLPVDHRHRALSFLPINHSFERMLTYLYMSVGISIYYAESMETIGDNIREIHPHIFTAVPRLLEKVYDKIVAKGAELTGIKKSLFFWALNLGLNYDLQGKGWWYETQLKLANKIIFNKWREALGGELLCIVSGSAALQERLAKVFTSANIVVLEGYGLTETSPVISVNRFNKEEGRMFGTVGPPIQNVQVRLADDGEIIVKGPNIMKGYYKRDDLTKEVMDSDGWFHTGDIGAFVKSYNGVECLKITDRKKELFKTSGGKYIAPLPIENKFKESSFIEQIMVVGENEKFVSALIVPAFPILKQWCEKNGIDTSDKNELVKNSQVLKKYQEIVNKFNEKLGHVEQVKKIILVPEEWSVESGDLTPTMKVKRKVILAKYKDLIEKTYRSGH